MQPGGGGQRFRNAWNLENIDVNAGVDVPLARHAILPFAVVAHGSIEAVPRMSKSTISDEEMARIYLEGRIWPNGPRCPDCGGRLG